MQLLLIIIISRASKDLILYKFTPPFVRSMNEMKWEGYLAIRTLQRHGGGLFGLKTASAKHSLNITLAI